MMQSIIEPFTHLWIPAEKRGAAAVALGPLCEGMIPEDFAELPLTQELLILLRLQGYLAWSSNDRDICFQRMYYEYDVCVDPVLCALEGYIAPGSYMTGYIEETNVQWQLRYGKQGRHMVYGHIVFPQEGETYPCDIDTYDLTRKRVA